MFYVIIVHHYFSKKKNQFLHIMSTTTTPPIIDLLERDLIRDGGGPAMSCHELATIDIKEGR